MPSYFTIEDDRSYLLAADDAQQKRIANTAGGVLYYSDSAKVSAEAHEGELAVGEELTFKEPTFFISASRSTVVVADLDPHPSRAELEAEEKAREEGDIGDATKAALEKEEKLRKEVEESLHDLGFFNIGDAKYGAVHGAEVDNAEAIQAAIDDAAEAYEKTEGLQRLWVPGGKFMTGTLNMKTGVVLDGIGTFKLVPGKTDLLSTHKLGEGGQDFYVVRGIRLDGNAANGGLGSCWNSDGHRVRGWDVEVFNAAEHGFRHRQSGADLTAAAGGDDSFFAWIFAYNNTTTDILDEAHDCGYSHCRMIGKAKVGFKNTGAGTQAILYDCHVWSKSERHEYDYNFEGTWQATACTAEGASKAQVRVKGAGVWNGGRIFSVEGAEAVPLFEVVESSSRLTTKAVVLACAKGNNTAGAFKAGGASAGSGSQLDFIFEGGKSVCFTAAEGASWSENIAVDPDYRGEVEVGTPPQAPSVPSEKINGEELIKRAHLGAIKISGEKEIKKLPVTFAGHLVTFIMTGKAKWIKGENLKLASNFEATEDDTLTLRCGGTNWYEAGRSVN